MKSFPGFDVRIDPWAVDYGGETPTQFQPEGEDPSAVELGVERDVSDWKPILPPANLHKDQPLSFVDGVRRMEARLVEPKRRQLFRRCHPFGLHDRAHDRRVTRDG